jgi:hypothetical protein
VRRIHAIFLVLVLTVAGAAVAGSYLTNPGTSTSTANGLRRVTIYGDTLWIMPYDKEIDGIPDGNPPASDLNAGSFWLNGRLGCNRVMVYDAGGVQCVGSVPCPERCR